MFNDISFCHYFQSFDFITTHSHWFCLWGGHNTSKHGNIPDTEKCIFLSCVDFYSFFISFPCLIPHLQRTLQDTVWEPLYSSLIYILCTNSCCIIMN
jgi:hypothetical protein